MRGLGETRGCGVKVVYLGRKRKSGRRNRSGDLVREKVDYRLLAALQPHRRDLPETARLSEKAGTVLGNLNLTGCISDQQHEAGRLYAADCGAYFATIGVPTGIAGGGRGYDCRGERVCDDCECLRRKARYNAAFEAVMAAGQRAAKSVAHVAVHGKPVLGELIYLSRGLSALVRHYGLTSSQDYASRKIQTR